MKCRKWQNIERVAASESDLLDILSRDHTNMKKLYIDQKSSNIHSYGKHPSIVKSHSDGVLTMSSVENDVSHIQRTPMKHDNSDREMMNTLEEPGYSVPDLTIANCYVPKLLAKDILDHKYYSQNTSSSPSSHESFRVCLLSS